MPANVCRRDCGRGLRAAAIFRPIIRAYSRLSAAQTRRRTRCRPPGLPRRRRRRCAGRSLGTTKLGGQMSIRPSRKRFESNISNRECGRKLLRLHINCLDRRRFRGKLKKFSCAFYVLTYFRFLFIPLAVGARLRSIKFSLSREN